MTALELLDYLAVVPREQLAKMPVVLDTSHDYEPLIVSKIQDNTLLLIYK